MTGKRSIIRTKQKQRAKPSLEDIKEILRQHLPRLREEHGVGNLWLFGSYVRGEERPASDLDILVEFEKTPDLFKFVRLERDLKEITNIKVDLVSIRSLKGEIGQIILEERVQI